MFFFATAVAVAGPRPLIEFENGNQIFGSTLTIFDDGSLAHGERACCPPKTTPVDEPRLTERELADLNSWISASAGGVIKEQEGEPTREGGQSGFLTAPGKDRVVIIHEIAKNPEEGGRDRVRYNSAPEATKIERLVNRYVKNPLYPVK